MNQWILPVLGFSIFAFISTGYAQELNSDNNRIERLEERIRELETGKQDRGGGHDHPSGNHSPESFSPTFNPEVDIHGLLLGSYISEGNGDTDRETKTGIEIQEVEVIFSANVDHWLYADLTLAIEGDEGVEIEELVVEGTILNQLSFRAGKFFTPFGKHNLLHTHSFPFIDGPLINEEILGEEGLNETGMGVDYRIPIPWLSSLSLQFLEGENDLFSSPANDDFLYLAHWKNVMGFTSDLTTELGGSFAYGKNDLGANGHTDLYGTNLTFKWEPAGHDEHHMLIWQTEYIQANAEVDKKGFYSLTQYQFAKQWWGQGRYDFLNIKSGAEDADKHRYSALLAFIPSEYTTLRLQYNYLDQFQQNDEHQLLLQLNFSLGSHSAHGH